MPWTGRDLVDWAEVASAVSERGWLRLEGVVDGRTRAVLAEASPSPWTPLPEVEGRVRQGGLSCGVFFDDAPAPVREFGHHICNSLSDARHDWPRVPDFNEVQWGRSLGGIGFITAHRDPPGVGGVIVIATLSGRALFRIWQGSRATEWETEDGDLVLLRGRGWPTDDALCPVHEVHSPRVGDRMTMTLRHNVGGPGADYFPINNAGGVTAEPADQDGTPAP